MFRFGDGVEIGGGAGKGAEKILSTCSPKLRLFCRLSTLKIYDWVRKLAPLSRPIRYKNQNQTRFGRPHFFASYVDWLFLFCVLIGSERYHPFFQLGIVITSVLVKKNILSKEHNCSGTERSGGNFWWLPAAGQESRTRNFLPKNCLLKEKIANKYFVNLTLYSLHGFSKWMHRCKNSQRNSTLLVACNQNFIWY